MFQRFRQLIDLALRIIRSENRAQHTDALQHSPRIMRDFRL